MSITLSQVIQTLKDRGEKEDAEQCESTIVFDLAFLYGFSREKILGMTMDEIEEWYEKWYNVPPRPAKYAGWNNFYWGKEVVG